MCPAASARRCLSAALLEAAAYTTDVLQLLTLGCHAAQQALSATVAQRLQKRSFWKNHLFFPVLNFSSIKPLTSCRAQAISHSMQETA